MTVDIPAWERERVGRYFVSLLRDLGFRARLRVTPDFDDYFARHRRGTARACRWGSAGWLPDYMSASTLLDPTFACAARGDRDVDNVSHVCDAGLDAAIDRARAAAADDAPAAWAAVDRRIVDLAPAVPYVNGRLDRLRVEAGRQRHATTRRTPPCSTRCGCADGPGSRMKCLRGTSRYSYFH